MRGPERLLRVFVVQLHFARQRLLRVLLVMREGSERLVVDATLACMRWLEGSIVLHGRNILGLRRALGKWDILTDHFQVTVEEMSLLGLLREGLVLQEGISS